MWGIEVERLKIRSTKTEVEAGGGLEGRDWEKRQKQRSKGRNAEGDRLRGREAEEWRLRPGNRQKQRLRGSEPHRTIQSGEVEIERQKLKYTEARRPGSRVRGAERQDKKWRCPELERQSGW